MTGQHLWWNKLWIALLMVVVLALLAALLAWSLGNGCPCASSANLAETASSDGGLRIPDTLTKASSTDDWAARVVIPAATAISSSPIKVLPGKSVQEAVNSAPEGATLLLEAGTWKENLRIARSVVLQGEGAASTRIEARQPGEPVLWVSASEDRQVAVRVQGVTLTDAYSDSTSQAVQHEGQRPYGVAVDRAGQCELVDCVVRGNFDSGVAVYDQARLQLDNCRIVDNGSLGIEAAQQAEIEARGTQISGGFSVGLHTEDSAKVLLQDCSIHDFREDGVEVYGASQVRLENTTISDCTVGIWVSDRSQVSLIHSSIAGHREDGITITRAGHVTLEETEIVNNTGYGIYFMYTVQMPSLTFADHVSGTGNTIPGPAELKGNLGGSVSPTACMAAMVETGVREPVDRPAVDNTDSGPFLNEGLMYSVSLREDAIGKEDIPENCNIVLLSSQEPSVLTARFGRIFHSFWVEKVTDASLELMEYYVLTGAVLRDFIFHTDFPGQHTQSGKRTLAAGLHYGWIYLREMEYPPSVATIHEKYVKATEPAGWYLAGGLPNSTMVSRALSAYGPGGLRGCGYRSSFTTQLVCEATAKLIALLKDNGIDPY